MGINEGMDDKETPLPERIEGASPANSFPVKVPKGELLKLAREYLNSLTQREASVEAYERFISLVTTWRLKRPTEWAMFRTRTRDYPAGERRFIKLQRAVEFAENGKQAIREETANARERILEADKIRKMAERAEVRKTVDSLDAAEDEARLKLSLEVMNFPPALKKGSPLGHDGRLSKNEIAHLKALGYDVQHYKQAIGPRQVELYLQGCILGTIDYTDDKYKAVESMRKHYMRVSKDEAEAQIKKSKTADPVKLLSKWGTPIGTEKFGGQQVHLRADRKLKTKEEAETARAKAVIEKLEEISERSFYVPGPNKDEQERAAADFAQKIAKTEVLNAEKMAAEALKRNG